MSSIKTRENIEQSLREMRDTIRFNTVGERKKNEQRTFEEIMVGNFHNIQNYQQMPHEINAKNTTSKYNVVN
jgi:hypothetical protein